MQGIDFDHFLIVCQCHSKGVSHHGDVSMSHKLYRIFVGLVVGLSLAAMSVPAQAKQSAYNFVDSHRIVYVGKGQTLSELVETIYRDYPHLWAQLEKLIVRKNLDAFIAGNPNRIIEGKRLRLVNIKTVSPAKQESIKVGRTLDAQGQVVAINPHDQKSVLKTGHLVHEGDKIVTGDGASAKMVMSDGAVLFIRSNSELVIEDYVYDQRTKEGKSILNLLTGGLRTVTGAIAKNRNNDYLVRTHIMTIGVRGTDYAVRVCGTNDCTQNGSDIPVGEGVYVGVIKGVVDVNNQAGGTRLKKGQFLKVSSESSKPKLITEPEGLLFAQAEKRISKDIIQQREDVLRCNRSHYQAQTTGNCFYDRHIMGEGSS